MDLALGIDLGSTNVAVSIVDIQRRLPVSTATQAVNGRIRGTVPGSAEYDADAVVAALAATIESLSADLRRRVGCIGVTGQMHGVMLWNHANYRHSHYISWQDRRTVADGFLARIRERAKDNRISAGYGCVTLAWLQAHESEIFEAFDRAGTLPDYMVAWLCDGDMALMDPVMAHSWGMFDLTQRRFSETRCKRAGVPMKFLPQIVPSGTRAGALSLARAHDWGLTPSIPVAVATGDNPAAIYATLREPEHEIALNVGTAAQLGVVVPVGATLPAATLPTVEYRPYVDDRVLVVAAALVGGEAYAWLVGAIQAILGDLGVGPITDDAIYARINELGLAGLNARTAPGGLEILPSFRGERANPGLDGAITGINMDNFTLGNLGVALGSGMLRNLMAMMPEELLVDRRRVVCSGNGIRRSQLLRKLVVEEFRLPITMPGFREEAASGVALLAADHLTAGSGK